MKKALTLALVLIIVLTVQFITSKFSNTPPLSVTFCDVGQGDATLIRTKDGTDILIDAGPDSEKITDCLESKMPFWDKKVDLAILTHPHLDHFYGFFEVLKRYEIEEFVTENLENDTQEFKELMNLLDNKEIKKKYVLAGDKFRIGDSLYINILGPSQSFLNSTSPHGNINESKEFASIMIHLSYNDFDALLTGDSQTEGMHKAVGGLNNIEIFQIPHHGSKTGLDESLLSSLRPDLSIISVGKNRYGHPSKEILSLLKNQNLKYLRTDLEGSVTITTDGKAFRIEH